MQIIAGVTFGMLVLGPSGAALAQPRLVLNQSVSDEPTVDIVNDGGEVVLRVTQVNPLDDVGQQTLSFSAILCDSLEYAGRDDWTLVAQVHAEQLAHFGLSLMPRYHTDVWIAGSPRLSLCGRAANAIIACRAPSADVCASLATGGAAADYDDLRRLACWEPEQQVEQTPTVYRISAASFVVDELTSEPRDVLCAAP